MEMDNNFMTNVLRVNELIATMPYVVLRADDFLVEKLNGHRRLRRGKVTIDDNEIVFYVGCKDIPEARLPHAFRWAYGDVKALTFIRVSTGEAFEIVIKEKEELPLRCL